MGRQKRPMLTNTSLPRPEFFRLPTRGGDPHFGLTRPWYYAAEKRGAIKLKRIRERGKLRGITLVPYDEIAAFIHSQTDATTTTPAATEAAGGAS